MIGQGHGRVTHAKRLAAVALLWFGAGAVPALGAGVPVRLAVNVSPISGMAIVAEEGGFFDARGLDVTISNFTSGRDALNSVLGGAADLATTAEAPVTAATMAGQPIAFLARMEYSDLKTLTRAGAAIAAPADLRGKRVAFTAGTGGEVYTMALLANAGLAPADVSLVNLRPQDMLPAMAAGDIDAFNTWEPHISNGRKALGDGAVLIDTAGTYFETFNIVAMQGWLAANPDTADAFLTALLDAEAWMKGNREDAIALVASAVGMDAADLAGIWDDYVFELTLDQKQMDVLTAHAAWRLSSGNHPDGATMPDFTTVIFPEPLRRVAPDRVRAPF